MTDDVTDCYPNKIRVCAAVCQLTSFLSFAMFHLFKKLFATIGASKKWSDIQGNLKLQNTYHYYHWLATFSTFSFPAANFYHSTYIPNPNTCKATNNNSIKNPVNDVKRIKLKSFLTTILKLKSDLIALSSKKQLRTSCQILANCSNNFTDQCLCNPLNHEEKSLHHRA